MGVNTQSAPTCAELETFLAGQAVRAYDYLGAHPGRNGGLCLPRLGAPRGGSRRHGRLQRLE